MSENQLTEQLLQILKDSGHNDQVGILTTEHRDTLAEAYEHLIKGWFFCGFFFVIFTILCLCWNWCWIDLLHCNLQILLIRHPLTPSQSHFLSFVWINQFQSQIQMMTSIWLVLNWSMAADQNKIAAIAGSIKHYNSLWIVMELMALIMNIPRLKVSSLLDYVFYSNLDLCFIFSKWKKFSLSTGQPIAVLTDSVIKHL